MTINEEICKSIRNANFCHICAAPGEEGCPLLSDNRTGERRMFDRRTGYRRLADEGIEARVC